MRHDRRAPAVVGWLQRSIQGPFALLKDGEPSALRAVTVAQRMRLGVKIQYRIVEADGPKPWKVRTAAYKYTIETDDGRECSRTTGIRTPTAL